MTDFGARWSGLLKGISLACTLLLAGVVVILWREAASVPAPALIAMTVGFGLLLLVSALFVVRGYALEPSELVIRRLLWTTRFPLRELERVWVDPEAMKGSIRLFGNGGLYSFTGLYSNKRLGRYRAFVTDGRDAVVLKFASRTVVISPDRPDRFLASLVMFCPEVLAEPEPT